MIKEETFQFGDGRHEPATVKWHYPVIIDGEFHGVLDQAEVKVTCPQLLSKKTKPKTNPNYKPQKASGYTAAERKKITRKGERVLRDIVLKATGKKKESELKHPISSSGYKGYKKKD